MSEGEFRYRGLLCQEKFLDKKTILNDFSKSSVVVREIIISEGKSIVYGGNRKGVLRAQSQSIGFICEESNLFKCRKP